MENLQLGEFLKDNDYALALSPGFFRFYALMGVLCELEESKSIRVTHVSGSSAGALVGGFLAAGMKPKEMVEPVLAIKRNDIWDIGGIFGLLKGDLFQSVLLKNLPVRQFEDCEIPLGVTAYNLFKFQTSKITSGCIATAVRASCTFPGLFQPVLIDSLPHIDGGVFDHCGLMALPGIPESKWIVNIVCDQARLHSSSSKPPSHLPDARVCLYVCLARDIIVIHSHSTPVTYT